jgi:2-hydroxy-3-keto-5-methylthiopentenyl-1-phosphate phosphatase
VSSVADAFGGLRPVRAVTLVLDFDGTITEQETLDALVERFGEPEAHRAAQRELGRSLTLHEVIARGYGSLRVSPPEAVAWALENIAFRKGFRELVAHCRERGWRVVVVSSGVSTLIRPLLEREAFDDLELLCNELTGAGWTIAFRDEEPCETCGTACKRRTVTEIARGAHVVYVGDGYSDGCAAELADLVFARRRLADYLDERGLSYRWFDDFEDVLRSLEAEEPRGGRVDSPR